MFDSLLYLFFFFFSSRRRHTRSKRDWSSDVCSSDLRAIHRAAVARSALGVTTPPHRMARASPTVSMSGENVPPGGAGGRARSEERRVGKGCRGRWWPEHEKQERGREQGGKEDERDRR